MRSRTVEIRNVRQADQLRALTKARIDGVFSSAVPLADRERAACAHACVIAGRGVLQAL